MPAEVFEYYSCKQNTGNLTTQRILLNPWYRIKLKFDVELYYTPQGTCLLVYFQLSQLFELFFPLQNVFRGNSAPFPRLPERHPTSISRWWTNFKGKPLLWLCLLWS